MNANQFHLYEPVYGYSFVVANYRINGNTRVLFDEIGDQFHLGNHLGTGDVPDVMWRHIASPDPIFSLD